MLLDNVKELVAGHIGQGLTAGNRKNFSFDPEQWLAILHLDLEAIAGEGHDLFPQDDDLGLSCEVLVEDAYWLGEGC